MKNIIYIGILSLLLSACKKETFNINNLNNDTIYVLGHAGMGISDLYPINSLESIANCISLHATGSEMDIQMTKDSVLVAYHDHDLSVSTDISGVIHSMTWEEVQTANYVNGPFSSYSITTLENIFTSLEDYQSKVFTFDVKIYPGTADLAIYYETYANVIIDFFNTYGLEDNVYIESQSPEFLNLIQAKKPNYRLYYYPQTFDDGLAVALNNGFQGISISSKAINSDQVASAHEQGIFVTLWGVKTKDENKDAIRKNPDMIQTDNVKYLVDLLN